MKVLVVGHRGFIGPLVVKHLKHAGAQVHGIDDPTELGIKEKLAAAKDLLDRSGVVKTEKLEVQHIPVETLRRRDRRWRF